MALSFYGILEDFGESQHWLPLQTGQQSLQFRLTLMTSGVMCSWKIYLFYNSSSHSTVSSIKPRTSLVITANKAVCYTLDSRTGGRSQHCQTSNGSNFIQSFHKMLVASSPVMSKLDCCLTVNAEKMYSIRTA